MARDRIQTAMQTMEQDEKRMAIDKIGIQCDCLHHADTDPRALKLVPIKGAPGVPTYKCNSCKKIIPIKPLGQEKFNETLDTMDNIIDIIKLTLNLGNDGDKELAKKLAKIQFRCKTLLPKAWEAATKGKKKKKGNRGNNGSSSFQKPRVIR